MAGLHGSIFERDFKAAVAMPTGDGLDYDWTWNSDGFHLACTHYCKG